MPVSTILALVGVLLFSVRLTALPGVRGDGIGDSDPTYAFSGVPGRLMHERDVDVAGRSCLKWSTSNVYTFWIGLSGRARCYNSVFADGMSRRTGSYITAMETPFSRLSDLAEVAMVRMLPN